MNIINRISPLVQSHLQHEAVAVVLFATSHKDKYLVHSGLPHRNHLLHLLALCSALVYASTPDTNKQNCSISSVYLSSKYASELNIQ